MVEKIYFIFTLLSVGLTFGLGLAFLVIRIPQIPALNHYKKARVAMAAAYISLSVLNIVEIATRSDVPDMELTQSITIIMGAFQALLYTYTFITLINIHYVTRKKILFEVGMILLLSVLLFVALFGQEGRPYFDLVLYTFIFYYVLMLVRYTVIFLKIYRRYTCRVNNFFSEEEATRFHWIYYSFFAALAVGVGAMLLSFSDNTLHYIFFTAIFICFYFYFGAKFVEYAFLFGQIATVVTDNAEPEEEKKSRTSYADLGEKINLWLGQKGFVKNGITIEQLSHELNTNRTYISNYINSYYNQTFNGWINMLRIEEAKRILQEEPQLSVGEAGERVGYTDKSNFGRQFAKQMGVSPNAWRKAEVCVRN